MADWNLKEWLEALQYLTVILVPIVTGAVFLVRKRQRDIGSLTQALARAWTNEGDISSDESMFIDLELELSDGDLFGSLRSPIWDRALEAHVDVHWRSADLQISELVHKGTRHLATVELTLVGNRNRLNWKLKGRKGEDLLPSRTLLWPSPIRH